MIPTTLSLLDISLMNIIYKIRKLKYSAIQYSDSISLVQIPKKKNIWYALLKFTPAFHHANCIAIYAHFHGKYAF